MGKLSHESLTEEEVKLTFEQASLNDRDHLLLRLLARSGLRLGEVYGVKPRGSKEWKNGIRLRDLDLVNQKVRVYSTMKKTTVSREVPIDGITVRLFKKLIKDNDMLLSPDDSIFQTLLSYRYIQDVVKKYAKRAGISKIVCSHSYRDFFLRYSLENGMDIQTLQELAGFSTVYSVLEYVEKTEDASEQYNRIFK